MASFRMSAVYLDEIARRYPKITVIGAHCGNRNTSGQRKSRGGTQMCF